MIELQLKKARIEQTANELTQSNSKGGVEFDRNELLKHIVQVSHTKTSDK
jgi:hypothetical protein